VRPPMVLQDAPSFNPTTELPELSPFALDVPTFSHWIGVILRFTHFLGII
jgi:hypothetical protein